MHPETTLQHKYRIVSGLPNLQDFVSLLKALQDQVCDVRTKIPGADSVEARQGANFILQGAIDQLSTMGKNKDTIGQGDE